MSKKIRRSLSSAREITDLVLAHYMSAVQAHQESRWVAWCTAVAPPSEIPYSMGIQPLFPENYACVATVMRTMPKAFEISESHGLSRDLCSYARGVMGFVLGGEAPLGGMEKPDILISTKNVCLSYLKWWQLMAHSLRRPLYVIDCPRITSEIEEHHLRYVSEQLEDLVLNLEKITERTLDKGKLKEALEFSSKAAELWQRVLGFRKASPCPMGVTDSSAAMFPLVASAGTMEAVKYYEKLLDEVSERVETNTGVIEDEKFRLLLSGIPYWHHLDLFNYLKNKYSAVFVYELYTATWGITPLNSTRPFESLAFKMLYNPTNLPPKWAEEWIAGIVNDFDIDGIVLLSSRSCKATSINNLVIHRVLRDKYGIPSVVIEADHTDHRDYSDTEAKAKLDTFMEILKKYPKS